MVALPAALRLRLPPSIERGFSLMWPMGNGDRGPPGTWQRSANPAAFAGEEMTAFSAVYACTNIISQDVAKMPVQTFRVDRDGTPLLQRADYYARLLARPNDYQTGTDFMALFVLSYLLSGNAYAYGRRNGRGEFDELHVLNPRTVQPCIEPQTREIFYRCGQNVLAGLKGGEMVAAADMIHHRLALLPGYPLLGVTPVYAAAASSSVGLRILSQSQAFFSNSARPSGVVQSPNKVSEDLSKRVQEAWGRAYTGENTGKVAILPDGMTFNPLTMTSQDAQLIEQLRWSVEDVARVFRVPPHMIGDNSKVTYRNTEQLGRVYLSGCLSWHIEALEQRFERAFEFPPDWQLRFDLAVLLKAEADIRFTAYTQALNAGWVTINEVRSQEGLAPVAGGEEPHLQQQYVPLSMSGQAPPSPSPAPSPGDPPAPPAEDEDEDEDEDAEQEASIDPALLRRLVRARVRERLAA